MYVCTIQNIIKLAILHVIYNAGSYYSLVDVEGLVWELFGFLFQHAASFLQLPWYIQFNQNLVFQISTVQSLY